MILPTGTRIRFIHTGAAGKMKGYLDNHMIEVELEDGSIIPAFINDVIDESTYNIQILKKAQIERGAPKKSGIIPIQDPNLYDHVLLIFIPSLTEGGILANYKIYIINGLTQDIFVDTSDQSIGFSQTSLLVKQKEGAPFGKMDNDLLNEQPKFEINVSWSLTDGSKVLYKSNIHLKAKNFFKKAKQLSLFEQPVYAFQLNDSTKLVKEQTDNLASHTQDLIERSKISKSNQNYRNVALNDVNAMAAFQPEIDLHIENLQKDADGMTNAQIIQIQLRHFDSYLNEAIRLGIDNFFVIHGIGKGKLKFEVEKRLAARREVDRFKNEFHTKYGFGATEVFLIK